MNRDDALEIKREFDAPISLIWSMWTDATHFEQWYGPPGFSVQVLQYQVHVGGRRHLCMQSPDGKMKMWFVGEFREVQENRRLVYTDSNADEHGEALAPAALGMPGDEPKFTEVTVALRSLDDGRCAMHMTHRGIPSDSPGAKGWQMAFEKLASYVETASEQ